MEKAMSSFISLHGLSKIAKKDPRKIAADLLRLGITPDAELQQENRAPQPLFDCDRVEALAKLLTESWKRNTNEQKYERL
jgi:hypothetical protein